MGLNIYIKIICAVPASIEDVTETITKYNEDSGEPYTKEVPVGKQNLLVGESVVYTDDYIEDEFTFKTSFGEFTLFFDHNTDEVMVGELVSNFGDAMYGLGGFTKVSGHEPSEKLLELAKNTGVECGLYHHVYVSV